MKITESKTWDLAVIGGGFRTSTFLASSPELLDYDVTIIESRDVIGPGAFDEYIVTTSSTGRSLFKNFTFQGPFSSLKSNSKASFISECDKPVSTQELASALREIGTVITDKLNTKKNSIRTNSHVKLIELESDESPVTIYLDNNETIQAKQVLLASGRRERPHPELKNWNHKVMLSSTAISLNKQEALKQELLSISDKPIVVAGCSHSAMSVLQVLIKVTNELKSTNTSYKSPPIYITQRNLTELMYENENQALQEQIQGREKLFDPQKDVCPATGVVFRDSGLRHKSKELYCKIWSGDFEGIKVVKIQHLSDCSELLESAGLVIQALGYHGEAPTISVSNNVVRTHTSDERIWGNTEGNALIGGREFKNLSILRLEPTPVNQRDNAAYGTNLYGNLAEKLKHNLTTSLRET